MYEPFPRRIILLATLALVALGAFLPAGAAAASGSTVSVFNSLVDLRPEKAAPGGGTAAATIAAAGNETESFQLLVQGGSAATAGVSVELSSALTGPGGATIPATDVTLYREGYYNVTQRSNGEGEVGSWPDALIPARDGFYGEARNAFPVELAAAGRLAVWVDVLVPAGQVPGAYSGALTVRSSEGTIATVPVALTVRAFALPATSSLNSAFFLQTSAVCAAFTGNSNCTNPAQAWQYDALFAEAGLDNRISLANAYAGAPSSPYFSQYFAPLVEGTDPRVDLPGAKLTAVEAYGPSCGSCIGEWKTAAEKYGFGSRFFDYICDEPASSGAWEECRANAAKATSAWGGVRTLVTAGYNSSAASYVSTFAPLINEIGSTQKSSYASFLQQGAPRELWLYTSCRSYSCDASEGSSFEGWPGYAIDAPATHARAMGWLSYLYGAEGELLYNTTQSLTTATTNQYVSGGNGDGNLFYAGTPAGGNGSIAVGGTKPIPIESIRLKRIRDGREDYEYLHLLEASGDGAYARSMVTSLFGSEATAAKSANVSTAALLSAHEQLGATLEGAVGGGPIEVPSTPETPSTPEMPTTPETPSTPAPPKAPETPKHGAGPKHGETPSTGGGSNGSGSGNSGGSSGSANGGISNGSTSGGNPASGASGGHGSVHIKVIRLKAPHSARGLAAGAIKALVECDVDCRVEVSAAIKAHAVKRLDLGVSLLGHGTAVLAAGHREWVEVTSNAAARRQLLTAAGASVPVEAQVQAVPV
jgi:hypothetical protein